LELIQGLMNMRVLARIVGDPELAQLVMFEFEGLETKQSPKEALEESEGFAIDFEHGALSPNEWREAKGRLPVDGGDILLVKTAAGYVTLDSILDMDEDEETEPEEEDDTPDAAAPEEGEEAPGEVAAESRPFAARKRSRKRLKPKEARSRVQPRARPGRVRSPMYFGHLGKHEGCGCEPVVSYRDSTDLLPSDWQPEGRFRDGRTIDLGALGRAIIDYKRKVSPLYRRARIDILSAFRSHLEDGQLDAQEAIRLSGQVNERLNALTEKWSMTTEPIYRRAARVGRDAATDISRSPVAQEWKQAGDDYHRQAMGYLTGTRGLISDLKSQLSVVISASVRGSRADLQVRDLKLRQGEDTEIDAAVILAAAAAAFTRNEHRIDNWSGRLVELANRVMADGLSEGTPEVTDKEGQTKPDTWVVAWEAAGDERTCPTCDEQSARGFIPLNDLTIHPGGATECRARCRCVLVFWLQSEVENGTARRA